MPLAIVYSRASAGMEAPLVTVEVDLSFGMVALNIVGLPETAVKESKDRVRSAIINSHFEFPIQKITINLAPADLPKEGSRFDLAIALGILAASDQIPKKILSEYEFIGELALTGTLRAVRGVLPAIMKAKKAGRKVIIPKQNQLEAALISGVSVFCADHLLEVCAHLTGKELLTPCETRIEEKSMTSNVDFSDVKGQLHAKRALEIAAAGKHSLLLIGPPGSGKTMLASRLPSILPPLAEDEALEAAAIQSLSRTGFDIKAWRKIPFRAPHHTSSSTALVGGGRPPQPGEISLAHQGVLFLDELLEFQRPVLESLREPLEAGMITISRVAYQMAFPAKFQFIAAMNPCPCGYGFSQEQLCRCAPEKKQRYLSKLSGPLLERIDMQIEVAPVPPQTLANFSHPETPSSDILKRVLKARQIQLLRQGKTNSSLKMQEIGQFCQLEENALQFLNQMMETLNLSARVYYRLIKLARTIADIENIERINKQHIGESLSYRCLDRRKAIIK